jgi:ABC-type oligopeptide transport system, periplasmic component
MTITKPKIIAIVAVITAIVFAGALYTYFTQNSGESYALAIADEPFCLDPQGSPSDEAKAVLVNLFTPLGEVITDTQMADGGKQYTFTIDGKGMWSTAADSKFDGSPVTAFDFAFSLSRLNEPNIAKVTALSEHSLQIVLNESDMNFEAKLLDIKYAPCNKEFFESTKAKYGMEAKFLLSNRFYLYSWSHGTGMTLARGNDRIRYTINENPMALFNEEKIDAGIFTARPTRANVDITINHKSAYGISLGTDRELSEVFTLGTRITEAPTDGKTAENQSYDISAAKAKMADKKITDLSVIVLEDNGDIADEVLQHWQKELGIFGVIERLSEKDFAARLAAGSFDVAFTENPGFMPLYQIPSYYCKTKNVQFVGDFIRIP